VVEPVAPRSALHIEIDRARICRAARMDAGIIGSMRWGLALFYTLAACRFTAPEGALPDADTTPPPPPDACVTFSSQFDTCVLTGHIKLDLSGALEFNTDSGVLTSNGNPVMVATRAVQTHGAEVQALLATSLNLQPGAKLHAVGSRAFAIVATGSITLQPNAVIDVSAGGAGARMTCDNGPDRGENDGGGAAGGGGGGYGAKGGDGGDGNSDGLGGDSDGGGGGEAAAEAPAGPLGGCPGAGGGDQSSGNPGGAPGLGGGAVYLVSNATLGLVATAGIQAGGGGGAGGTRNASFGDAGGGGGGAGGMIFLEARVLRTEGGILAANGGGGGQGSGNSAAGMPGATGLLSVDAAPGGQGGGSSGTNGAAGGNLAKPEGSKPTTVSPGGGGGGGGGVGIIRVMSPDQRLGTLVSPTPS
jgi:hypothetical protein